MHPQILIDYVKTHSIADLSAAKKIDVKVHKDYPNLIMLKYRQIEADFHDPIVRLCRGIILDSRDDWRVVNYTYSKFGNYGEGYADKIDLSSTRFYEKVDGSLIQMYWFNNQWNVATSGTPDAGGNVGDFGFTFKELFWKVWNELGCRLPDNTDCCYAFELCTKFNKVVIHHEKDCIILHGGRNLKTFKELNPIIEANNYKWECVKTFPFDSFEAMLEAAKSINGLEQEGFVACDDKYNRIKLKAASYVHLAHLKDSCGASKRQMLEIIRNNESEEFLAYFPEFKDIFFDIKVKFEHLVGQIEGFYEAIKDIDDRKSFALKATTQKFSGLLFAMKFGNRDGQLSSFHRGLSQVHIKLLETWLGIKNEDKKCDDEHI
jgi:hypothetical protein